MVSRLRRESYFDKGAGELTLAESAMLAGLVQAPSRLAPTRNPAAARDRASLVLTAMADQGYIDETRMANAMARPAQLSRPLGPGTANYAADYVMDVLDDSWVRCMRCRPFTPASIWACSKPQRRR